MIPSASNGRQRIPRVTGHKGMDYLLAVNYKAVLYFSTTEEPRIVRLERAKIAGFDFRPLLDPDDQGNGGTAHIKGVRTEDASKGFTLFYFEQTERNGFPINDSVTRELEGFTDGLRRPWLGPILVVWDEDNVITSDNLAEKAEEIISSVHNFYEDFVRDDGVPYDRLEGESDDEGHNDGDLAL